MINDEFVAPCVDNETLCPWLADGDVFVDVCVKCGTTWMMTIVHELRTLEKPHLREVKDILDVSPWAELVRHPKQKRRYTYEDWGLEWNNTELQFKQYKTHLLPHRKNLLPVRQRPNVKFIVMVRNPEDILLSTVKFSKKMNQDF